MKQQETYCSGLNTSLTQSWRNQSLQAGQALPLGLAFILIGMLSALVLFNTGQVAVDKQRLANAADSAAYSGMVWQARALNFQAYTNRAMVANQVSIGQAVSLHSWSDYAEQSAVNAQTVLGPIPYVGQFVSIMANVIRTIATITRPVAQGMIAAIGPINEAVGVSQQAMYASSFAAAPDIVRDVAKASDSRFTADTAYSALGLQQNLTGWSEFTQQYTHDAHLADMSDRTKLVNDSRDKFSEHRYWDFFDSFWVYSTPFTKHKVFREGATNLVMSVDNGDPTWEWMAKDTMALHTRIWRGWRGTKKIEIPMGWGAAYANDSGGGSMALLRCSQAPANQRDYCRFRNRNRKTEAVANSTIASMNSYTGVQAFRSISEKIRNPDEGKAVLKLKTEVSMELGEVRSSDRYINDRQLFVTPMVSPANKLSSISVAEVYYRRPEAYSYTEPRDRHKRFEPANGYNPYWDVRLAPVDAEDRLVALGLRGDLGSTSTLPGGAAAEALANYEPPESDADSGSEGDAGQSGNAGLPGYADETLASVMGVAESQVSALVASAPTNFDVTSIAGYMGGEQIENLIKKKIEEEVRDAALSFITSTARSTLDQAAPGVIDGVQRAQAAADQAIALADELSQKFETLREQVQAEFEAELIDKVAEYEVALSPILDEIRTRRAELDSVTEEINRLIDTSNQVAADLPIRQRQLEAEIANFRDRAQTLYEDLQRRLTNYLIDRIEHYGRGLLNDRMPFPQMFEITTFLLQDYLETPADQRGSVNVNDQLPWGQDDDV